MEYLLFIMARRVGQRNHRAGDELISKQGKRALRHELLALVSACPFHHANPEDCPLFTLRQMEPQLRSQWLEALSAADLSYLISYHQVCLATKLSRGTCNPAP